MNQIDKMLNGGIKAGELLVIGNSDSTVFIPEVKIPIPQHNDSRLTAFDKLNENVLHALISGYPQDKQLSMVSMSIQEITDHENAAKHLKECFDLSHPKFVEFEEKQEFWRTFKLHMESRQKYIRKLMY
jgi:hypothetical protein